ncbi:MAG: hypothetical protein VW455_10560 [Nitrospinota bacterium]
MKYDNIKYLKGTTELYRLAEEEYEKFIFNRSFDGFFRPVRFKNRYRKSRFEDEDNIYKRPKFSAIKKWSNQN